MQPAGSAFSTMQGYSGLILRKQHGDSKRWIRTREWKAHPDSLASIAPRTEMVLLAAEQRAGMVWMSVLSNLCCVL